MDVIKSNQAFEKYNKATGNPFLAVRAIANDARKHQIESNFVPTVSESITYVTEGTEPQSIKDYVAFYDRVDRVIDEDLEGVLDRTVKSYVRKSIMKSLKGHKLIYLYPYNDEGINPKIRIHCKQIWSKLGLR